MTVSSDAWTIHDEELAKHFRTFTEAIAAASEDGDSEIALEIYVHALEASDRKYDHAMRDVVLSSG